MEARRGEASRDAALVARAREVKPRPSLQLVLRARCLQLWRLVVPRGIVDFGPRVGRVESMVKIGE